MEKKYPTITQLISSSIEHNWTRKAFGIFVGGKEDEISFGDLWTLSQALAHRLKETNIGKGDQVILSGKASIGWVAYALACFRLGAVVVPIDTELGILETANVYGLTKAKLVVADKERKEKWENLQVDIWEMEEKWDKKRFMKLPRFDGETVIDPLVDLAIIPFTSGTTAEVGKGVMLTHANITSDVQMLCDALRLDNTDTIFTIAPWYHITGFTCALAMPLARGITVLQVPKIEQIARVLPKLKDVTIILAVPKFYHTTLFKKVLKGRKEKVAMKLVPKAVGKKLANKLLSNSPNFRFFVSGGAKLDAETGTGFQRMGFCIVDGYGLSETSPVATFTREGEYKPDCVGKPLPGVEVRINNQNEKGLGEICVRGPNVMLGYYNNPEATAEVIDKDKWFHTGDIGHIKDGELYIKGRLKNLIVTPSGKNVYPEEIESVLRKSLYVEDVLVFGSLGNHADSEIVTVEIYPDFKRFKEDEITEESQIHEALWQEVKRLQKSLANFKHINNSSLVRVRKEPFALTTKKEPKRNRSS